MRTSPFSSTSTEPLAVTVTLADEIDLSRGDMLVHEGAPPQVARSIEAMVVWMNEQPMALRGAYLLKHGTRVVSAELRTLHRQEEQTRRELAAAVVVFLLGITQADRWRRLWLRTEDPRALGLFLGQAETLRIQVN